MSYKVQFKVDEREALRRGIGPAGPTVVLNLMREDGTFILDEEQREILADALTSRKEWGPLVVKDSFPQLKRPDLLGLFEVFTELEQRKAAARIDADRVVREALDAGPKTRTEQHKHGDWRSVAVPLLTQAMSYVADSQVRQANPDLQAQWAEAEKRVAVFNQNARSTSFELWKQRQAEADAVEAERAERIARERNALILMYVPLVTRQRLAEGFATKDEIDRILCRQIRGAATFVPPYRGHRMSEATSRISDEAYLALDELRRKLPDDVNVEVRIGNDYEQCPECDDTSCGNCDKDNEVVAARWYFARLTWTVADLEIRANVELGPVE